VFQEFSNLKAIICYHSLYTKQKSCSLLYFQMGDSRNGDPIELFICRQKYLSDFEFMLRCNKRHPYMLHVFILIVIIIDR
jgi:hypothetical protein